MSNISIDGMSRTELVELRAKIVSELGKFRPYRIKERSIKCGRTDCRCFKSEQFHGPYLYATYRKGGKTRTMSLGAKMSVDGIIATLGERPFVWSYLYTPDYKYKKMPAEQVRGWVSLKLSGVEFFSRYGVSMEDDNFNRATKFWGSSDAFGRYTEEIDIYNDRVNLRYNKWVGWGIGTLEAVAKLTTLENEGYYQR